MTSTGCIGYVTEKTFERLLPAVTKGGHAPWMANFVLRLWSFEPIEETLSDWGYVTEKLQDRRSGSGVSSTMKNASRFCRGFASGASIRPARKPRGICIRSSIFRDRPTISGKCP